MPSKIAILVNPKSGNARRNNRVELIQEAMPAGVEYELLLWERFEQKEELFRKALSGDYRLVAAAGGDGTVNSLASALSGTQIPLAIIPFGSGNGLARHLNIPLQTAAALQLLKTGKIIRIDTCYLNDKTFFCTAGTGFDAHIGKLFAESRNRGFRTYAWMTLREIRKYSPQTYTLWIDGEQSDHNAFLVTFANAAQYGSKAYIAPQANIQDGLIDIILVPAFRFRDGLALVYHLFNKTLHTSNKVTILRGKHIILERSQAGSVQYDGEPAMMGTRLEIRIQPQTLQVLVPGTK
jgi:diacylglycerol kinase (ATP)